MAGDVASQALNEALRVSFRLLKLAMVLVAVLFLTSGLFTVRQHEQAFKLRFGRLVVDREDNAIIGPGLHFAWPFLIDEIVRFPVQRKLKITIPDFWYIESQGLPGAKAPPGLHPDRGGYNITGDANILHTGWTVIYNINDPVRLCRHLADPAEIGVEAGTIDRLINTLARNAVIRTMARFNVDDAYRGRRDLLRDAVADALTNRLAQLDLGIRVERVILEALEPPQRGLHLSGTVGAAETFYTESDKRALLVHRSTHLEVVLTCCLDECQHVFVVERIENLLPRPPAADQPHGSQEAQMVRHGGHRDPQDACQVADAQFLLGQQVQDPGARLVSQRTEQLGQAVNLYESRAKVGLRGRAGQARIGADTGARVAPCVFLSGHAAPSVNNKATV
jgi:regulator of protease activity HflC (stomatin/prohibitin superfamily)